MRISLRGAQAGIVLGASDHSGLLHGLDVGARIGCHLLGRTAKGAIHLVGSVDHGYVNDRGKISIERQSQHVESSLSALLCGEFYIAGLSDFCSAWSVTVNITQSV